MAKSKRRQSKKKKKPSNKIPDWIPKYTGSLDAALPGENIVSIQQEEYSGKWIAVNRSSDGRLHIGVGNTEPLARRVSAMTALMAQRRPEYEPAKSDGRVGLDRNSMEFKKLIEKLDQLIKSIDENNAYAISDPEDRDKQLSDLRSIKDTLSSPDAIKASFIAATASTLTYLCTKFADTLVGNLAESVLDLLQGALGV